jgi:Leucine-rich repeat (LRR) protein
MLSRGLCHRNLVRCTALNVLYTSSNNAFTGTVPSELGLLTALTELQLDNNAFTGTVPSELGLLTALTYLTLDNNAFTGTVPSELGSLTVNELFAP